MSKAAQIKAGFFFGLSQFTQFAVFGIMFWVGGKLITANSDIDHSGKMTFTIDPGDIFAALFAIMFAGF